MKATADTFSYVFYFKRKKVKSMREAGIEPARGCPHRILRLNKAIFDKKSQQNTTTILISYITFPHFTCCQKSSFFVSHCAESVPGN